MSISNPNENLRRKKRKNEKKYCYRTEPIPQFTYSREGNKKKGKKQEKKKEGKKKEGKKKKKRRKKKK